MSLDYYNAILSMQPSSQKERYLEEAQAFIDREFSNSTTINTIQEENLIGTFLFNDIDVRLTHVVSDVTTGTKDGDDFRLILFQNLQKKIIKGLYYIFNNNYWLATFTDSSEAKKVIVRRCNNTMVDVNDIGKIIKYPCVMGYDASAFNPYVSTSIITPSNTIMIIVQGNDYTRSLKVNRRFLFNGRAFKIAGYNNYMENNMLEKQVDMVMFDLILDTPHVKDDFVNGLAYNEEVIMPTPIPTETTIILPQITEIKEGRTINLNAYLSVNKVKVTNPITCIATGVSQANFELIQVDDENFTLKNILKSSTLLTLTFTTIYNDITINSSMSIKLRAEF